MVVNVQIDAQSMSNSMNFKEFIEKRGIGFALRG